jgi:hypothetical protein
MPQRASLAELLAPYLTSVLQARSSPQARPLQPLALEQDQAISLSKERQL